MKKILLKYKKYENYLFLLPIFTFILFFILLPVIGTVINSFYLDVSFLNKKIIFFKNYFNLFNDKSFYESLKFTLLFVLVTVPIEIILGLILAILLNEVMPGRGLLRVIVLIPWAIPVAVSSKIWQLLYNYNYGLFNYLLIKSGILNSPYNFLGTFKSAFFSLVIADVWKTTPFVAIILLAGLQIIPEELYAQAKIDKTNFFQRFFKITLPLLKNVLIVAVLFRSIDAIRVFDLVYVLTGGGPGGSTTSLSLYSYKFFINGDFGYGSTISVVLFLISFLLILMYIKFSKFLED